MGAACVLELCSSASQEQQRLQTIAHCLSGLLAVTQLVPGRAMLAGKCTWGSPIANVGVCPSQLVRVGSRTCMRAAMLQLQVTTAVCILRDFATQWSHEKGQPRGNERKALSSANKPLSEQKERRMV